MRRNCSQYWTACSTKILELSSNCPVYSVFPFFFFFFFVYTCGSCGFRMWQHVVLKGEKLSAMSTRLLRGCGSTRVLGNALGWAKEGCSGKKGLGEIPDKTSGEPNALQGNNAFARHARSQEKGPTLPAAPTSPSPGPVLERRPSACRPGSV